MKSAIICIDDEWDILRSLGEQLKRNFGKEYIIELVNSGEEALSLCAELSEEGKDIALIISDQRMPQMQGDALLIQLHKRYSKALKIMLTGQADADSVGNAVNAAALYRYISKPWDETDLVLTVAEALRRFNQEQLIAQQDSSLKKINAELESSLSLLLATLEATADGILVLDCAGKVVCFNQRFADIWQLPDSMSTCEGHKVLDSISQALVESDKTTFQALLAQENIQQKDAFTLKNENIIEYYLQPQKLTGKVVGSVWSFRDVTSEKQEEAFVKHLASHDTLTNLPNRVLFTQKFSDALENAMDQSHMMAVMFLDLDRFKAVNDTLGHGVGDRLLQEVAQRFTNCLRESDIISRWGGDEFVLLLPKIQTRAETDAVARRLVDVIKPEFLIENNHINITVSVGVALYPDDGLDMDTLLQNADLALYQVKQGGRNNYQCCAAARY